MKTKTSIPILQDLIQSIHTEEIDNNYEMLSPNQVADELGMHINTIYKIISSGQLKVYDLSSGDRKSYYKIKRIDLDNYLEERYCLK